ncbi:hypothetical protein BKI52_33865 [marine bacterium AO1-C]|nr:hypothetical protein BKI52_33865 [marine bacterium AO1-C]
MNKAIFSLDKFAEGNHLSSSQLSAIKGGRKIITYINVKSSLVSDQDKEQDNKLDNPNGSKDDNDGELLPPPTDG